MTRDDRTRIALLASLTCPYCRQEWQGSERPILLGEPIPCPRCKRRLRVAESEILATETGLSSRLVIQKEPANGDE